MAAKSAKKGSSFMKRFFISLFAIMLVGMGIAAWLGYQMVYQPNVNTGDKKSEFIYIRTGWEFPEVLRMLQEKDLIKNPVSFEWLAQRKGYTRSVRPGRYRIKKGMSNNEIVNLLKAGLQEPVEFTLNEIRTKEQLASRVSGKLELDSAAFVQVLNDDAELSKYGMTSESVLTLFIPKRYKFYWNTGIKQFMDSMAVQYKAYWTVERKQKARAMGLSQTEVVTLASIVQHESFIEKERPLIAGVYLNRLKTNMPLQADPTLIWACKDFSIRRVLEYHKDIDSPYNTYRNKGLPPGPIGITSTSAIDAVLNHARHDYLYFCAKPDLSGYSDFAKDYKQHQVNARKYQEAMSRRNIMK